MRLRQKAWCSLLLAVLLMPSAAYARWYQVEVLVFRHLDESLVGGEQWPALSSLPDFRNAVTLLSLLPDLSDEPNALTEEDGSEQPVAFMPLRAEDRRLREVERRLHAPDYELLLSAAWRQPGFGVRRAKRVYLSDVDPALEMTDLSVAGLSDQDASVSAVIPSVEGVVAIKVSRLLHVDVDFIFQAGETTVRLMETRRLKLREIHYFDHPLFGVIVMVSPFVLPQVKATATVSEDEPEDPGESSEMPAALPD